MVLADRRFKNKRSQLPKWIAQALYEADTNLSTDMALANAKKFLRNLAQPTNLNDQDGVSVWDLARLEEYQRQQKMRHPVVENADTADTSAAAGAPDDFMDLDEADLDML